MTSGASAPHGAGPLGLDKGRTPGASPGGFGVHTHTHAHKRETHAHTHAHKKTHTSARTHTHKHKHTPHTWGVSPGGVFGPRAPPPCVYADLNPPTRHLWSKLTCRLWSNLSRRAGPWVRPAARATSLTTPRSQGASAGDGCILRIGAVDESRFDQSCRCGEPLGEGGRLPVN